MGNQKIKVGLILDSFDVPAWIFHSLEQILDSDCAEFSVILINNNADADHTGWFKKLWKNRSGIIYEIFNKIDEKIFIRGPNALEEMNLQKKLAGVPVIPIRPTGDHNNPVINPEDVKKIQEYNLDILINIGFQPLRGEIFTTAKYGIWFYEHSDVGAQRGGPPGFWEVLERRPVTGAALIIANETTPGGWVIYRSGILTYPFSPARTRNISLWVSSSFLPRQINLLVRFGAEKFFQRTASSNSAVDFHDSKPYQAPTNLNSIKLYTRLLFRDLYELFKRVLLLESWYLMFDVSEATTLSLSDLKKVVPPNDRFWADPQVIQKDDTYFIYVEEFLYKNHKGHISVIEMDAEGHTKDPVQVLETGYHLSYPFVFEYDNQYYMVPESAQNHTIDLYECVAFPAQWKYKMTLMDHVNAVDTTLFYYAEKWWLFTGITDHEGSFPEVELFLFYSDDLLTTEWKSHPLNPIISDVTCARPAGKIFMKGGKIYRPSQDCSKNYGYGININEILCLNETDYLEQKVAAVKPDLAGRLIATHTYTRVGAIQIIDGLTRRGKWERI